MDWCPKLHVLKVRSPGWQYLEEVGLIRSGDCVKVLRSVKGSCPWEGVKEALMWPLSRSELLQKPEPRNVRLSGSLCWNIIPNFFHTILCDVTHTHKMTPHPELSHWASMSLSFQDCASNQSVSLITSLYQLLQIKTESLKKKNRKLIQ